MKGKWLETIWMFATVKIVIFTLFGLRHWCLCIWLLKLFLFLLFYNNNAESSDKNCFSECGPHRGNPAVLREK